MVSKLNHCLSSLLHEAGLRAGRVAVRRLILIACILGLIAMPIVLVTRGFNLESIASYGYTGVFVATFLCDTTIIFPAPGGLVVVIAAAMFNPAWVALAAGVGGALGESTAYLVGRGGRAVIRDRYLGKYERAENWMRRYGFATIFLFALVPFLIFDLVGMIAGSTKYPYWKFLLATLAGRIPRSFAVAYLGWAILPYFFPFFQ